MIKSTVIFLLAIMPFITLGQNNSNVEVALRLEPTAESTRKSEGDFIKLKDGRILFVYSDFSGGEGDHSTAKLSGRFSDDNGKTWSTSDKLILPNEGKMNVMSVSMLRLINGNIALFYLRKNATDDCIVYMRISSDEAKTWSAPVKCIENVGYYVLNNDRVIQLKNGRIIFPVSLHRTPTTKWQSNGIISCYYSDDEGVTWNASPTVSNPDNVLLQEPGIVELKPEKLMLFCRTNKGVQYLSFSKDNGESWSAVEPSDIISPVSPATIERIPNSSDLLMVWNNNTNGDNLRTPLNIAISKNGGKKWLNIKSIETNPNGWYCYTSMFFIEDHVLLGYCAGDRSKNSGLETTQISRIKLDWLYDATTK